MKKLLVLAAMVLAFNSTPAQAFLVDATLTADNHFGLYYGNADASSLTFVGRNEYGPLNSPGVNQWETAENFSFDTGANEYLYVFAWDDTRVTQSFLGQFTGDFGTVLTNASSWQSTVAAGANPGDFGDLPLLSTLQNDILTATWETPLASKPYGSSPWGNIPGISSDADYIWHDTFDNASSSDEHYAIYRTQLPVPVAAVPEPATIALLGIGAGIAGLRRRFNKKTNV